MHAWVRDWLALGVLCMQWQTLRIIDRLETRLTAIEHDLTFVVNG
jgi:hypothetical protein